MILINENGDIETHVLVNYLNGAEGCTNLDGSSTNWGL
jgi:hypothetical protein